LSSAISAKSPRPISGKQLHAVAVGASAELPADARGDGTSLGSVVSWGPVAKFLEFGLDGMTVLLAHRLESRDKLSKELLLRGRLPCSRHRLRAFETAVTA